MNKDNSYNVNKRNSIENQDNTNVQNRSSTASSAVSDLSNIGSSEELYRLSKTTSQEEITGDRNTNTYHYDVSELNSPPLHQPSLNTSLDISNLQITNSRISIDCLVNNDEIEPLAITESSRASLASSTSLNASCSNIGTNQPGQSCGHNYVTAVQGEFGGKNFFPNIMKDRRLYDGEHKPEPLTMLEPYIYHQLSPNVERENAGYFEAALASSDIPVGISLAKSSSTNMTSFYAEMMPENLKFNLSICQQPQHCKACGWSDKDRKFLDPPPILKLTVSDCFDREAGEELPSAHLSPFLLVAISLWDVERTREFTQFTRIANDGAVEHKPSIVGPLLVSGYSLKDLNGQKGFFFFFPEISIRQEGKYRLEFKLISISSHFLPGTIQHSEDVKHIHASIFTEPFDVYSARDYPGHLESSEMTKHFARNGIKLPLRRDRRNADSD